MQTDATLVQAVLGGNRTAYAELVRRYERPVCAAAWVILRDSHASQDVAQDTFVKAYFKLSSLTRPEAFGAWILATARRVALSAARTAPQPAAVPWSGVAAAETPEADERTSLVLAAVARLPDHEQRAVMMRFIDGRTVAEIAEMTGHPVGTITKQLSRALARLSREPQGDAMNDERLEQELLRAGRIAGPARSIADDVLQEIERTGPRKTSVNLPSNNKGWWSMKLVRRSAVAAGFMLVASVAAVLVPWGGRGNATLADALEQARAAKAVRYKITMRVEPAGKGATEMAVDVLLVEPDWFIADLPGQKIIINRAKASSVRLLTDKKQAILLSGPDVTQMQGELNVLERVFRMKKDDEKPLGQKDLDGIRASGFSVGVPDAGRMDMWVDIKTDQMVSMVQVIDTPPKRINTFSNFQWNPVVDPKMLTLELPAGYEVIKPVVWSRDLENPAIDMFRQFALFNQSVFPEHLSAADMFESQKMWEATYGAGRQQWLASGMISVWEGMAAFADAGGDVGLRYGGAGVHLGDHAKPILWYKPTGGTAFRILDGDLSWRDAAEAPAGGEAVTIKKADLPAPASQNAATNHNQTP